MSPLNGQIYVDNIVKAFSQLDPKHAAQYKANGSKYKQQLQQVSDSLTASLKKLPTGHRTLVSCEGAFSYLTRDAGLKEIYLWPVNAEHEGTPQQIAAAVNKVKATGVPTLFCESTVNSAAMRQVASETGAKFSTSPNDLLYVDSLSKANGPVPTYLDLLKHDATTIADGLSRSGGAKSWTRWVSPQ